MKTIDLNTNLIDSYFTLLKSLSPNNKSELIAKLSKSMKTTKKTEIFPGNHCLELWNLTNRRMNKLAYIPVYI